jgi:trans-aconitate 2-methyltransferase
VSSPALDWDAQSYDRLTAPHVAWGEAVIERLAPHGDETVLDAGCGSGQVSSMLLERLPEGRLICVDASESMLEGARERLGADSRVELVRADLLELELDTPVDAVFSSAAFHWILDHDRLFARLHDALRPGARLEAQCGGQGNIAELERCIDALAGEERFAPYLRTAQRPWNYASVGDTESRLAGAGFADARAWLEEWPVTPRDPQSFLRTVILPWHLNRLPDELHEPFVEGLITSAPRPLTLDYVRLNISARRASDPS